MVLIINTITCWWMVSEAWNVHKPIAQEANLGYQKEVLTRIVLKNFINIYYTNWITGIKFHELQILKVKDLDNCVFYQCWKFDNIRLKPSKDIMCGILVTRQFGHSEKYWRLSFVLREPKLVLWMRRGGGDWEAEDLSLHCSCNCPAVKRQIQHLWKARLVRWTNYLLILSKGFS